MTDDMTYTDWIKQDTTEVWNTLAQDDVCGCDVPTLTSECHWYIGHGIDYCEQCQP